MGWGVIPATKAPPHGSGRVITDTWVPTARLRRCWEGDTCPAGILLFAVLSCSLPARHGPLLGARDDAAAASG